MNFTSGNGMEDLLFKAKSQSRIAEKLGIRPQSVQKWFAAGYVPLSRALQLEKLYGIPAIELVSPVHRSLVRSESTR
jgi:hypothetical protein